MEGTVVSPNFPELTGVVEKANRAVVTNMRPIFVQSGLAHKLWGYVRRQATLIKNVWPTKTNNFFSPASLYPNSPSSTFVCHLQPLGRNVLGLSDTAKVFSKVRLGAFLGLCHGGIYVLSLETESVSRSRNFSF